MGTETNRDKEILEMLENIGVDVKDLTERLMNNMNLITRFVRRFPDDKNYGQLLDGLEKFDAEEAFKAAHTLKGVCANLSMTKLYNLLSKQVEYLRAGDIEGGAEMMSAITEEYEKIVGAIEKIDWE